MCVCMLQDVCHEFMSRWCACNIDGVGCDIDEVAIDQLHGMRCGMMKVTV